MASQNAKKQDDIILKSARALLGFFGWAVILGGVAAFIGLPILAIFSQDILTQLSEVYVERPSVEVLWSIAGLLIVLMAILLLSYFTIDRLKKIVGSVSDGDPFTQMNGVRLRGMGVAILIIQILTIALGAVFGLVFSLLGEMKDGKEDTMHMDFSISLSGILLVLLLILLARVFDRGAEMREELDGTV